jgi:hypothetical protein
VPTLPMKGANPTLRSVGGLGVGQTLVGLEVVLNGMEDRVLALHTQIPPPSQAPGERQTHGILAHAAGALYGLQPTAGLESRSTITSNRRAASAAGGT